VGKSLCKCHPILRWDDSTHVDVVRHQVPFHHIPMPRCRQRSQITSLTCVGGSPYTFLFQYFGMAKHMVQSHRTWDNIWHSFIGFSSCPFMGLSQRKSLCYFSPDTYNLSGSSTRRGDFNGN